MCDIFTCDYMGYHRTFPHAVHLFLLYFSAFEYYRARGSYISSSFVETRVISPAAVSPVVGDRAGEEEGIVVVCISFSDGDEVGDMVGDDVKSTVGDGYGSKRRFSYHMTLSAL